MLGGAASADPDALTIRWYGTSNYELNFRDRVVLLDNYYDRGPRMRGLGFRSDEVTRADAILIGHPHYDHMSDTAQVARQTGAPVVIHPLGAEEEAYAAAVRARGSMAPEVMTEGTMCLVIDIDGYRIVYRDSGGPVSEEERAFFAASPGCDLAIVGFIGRPLVRRQLKEATMPLVEAYQPKVVLPCHHDDLYPVFIDLATEPLKMRVHERLPESRTIQPVYVEPVTIGRKTGTITQGEA
jgi:L-ascorbate metabolism protein UlaG (beta-lactamase superfamily)